MGLPSRRDIVILRFPFSDLSKDKVRPGLVLKRFNGGDVLCCQITSKEKNDGYSIGLSTEDLTSGYLKFDSFIRAPKLFLADQTIILGTIGEINEAKFNEVINMLCNLIVN